MLCPCHGQPMAWKPDKRRRPGGYMVCDIRRRASDAKNRKARQLRYWHKTNGGYIQYRRRALAAQRADITARLAQLEQEAAAC